MSKLNSSARDLVESARRVDQPSDEDRMRNRKAIAVRLAQGAIVTTGVATGSAAAAAAKTLLAISLLGLSVAGLAGYFSDAPAPTANPASTAAPDSKSPVPAPGALSTVSAEVVAVPSAIAIPVEPPGVATAAADSQTPPNVPPTAPSHSERPSALASALPSPLPSALASALAPPSKPAAVAARPSLPKGKSDLGAETEILRKAHLALRAGDHATAEKLLKQHANEHPDGQLQLEREAAQVLALCHQGKIEAAEKLLARLQAKHGDHPLLTRARRACNRK